MPRRTTGLPSPSRTPATPSPASMGSTTGTLSARRSNRPPPTRRERKVHKAALSPDLPEETSLEVVKALIDAGADINAGRQWRTHLGEFVTKGHLEVADLLIYPPSGTARTSTHCQTTARLLSTSQSSKRTTTTPLCSENAEASAPTSYPDARPSTLGGVSSYARLPPRAIIEIPSHRTWGSVGIGRRA